MQAARSVSIRKRLASVPPGFGWTPLALRTAVLLLWLTGCTAHLAPDYDATLVAGLVAANEQAETLFATLSSGTTAATFPQRQPTYDAVIGKFDALRLEAMARPNPHLSDSGLLASLAGHPTTPGAANPLQAPTPQVLSTIVAKLTRLRNQDRAGSLSPVLVVLAKNSYELSFEQALTYEQALQR